MGKTMVVGKAEQEFAPDRCEIIYEIETRAATATEASKQASEQCERLVEKLKAMGFEPGEIVLSQDRIDRTGGFRSEEPYYESKRMLALRIPVDIALVNRLRDIIEEGLRDVSFSAIYEVSNEAEIRRQLLKDAVADSRAKAEYLAESMGLSLAGVDSANLSGTEDVYDLCEESEDIGERAYLACSIGSLRPVLDDLTPEKVTISEEVKIVWLIE